VRRSVGISPTEDGIPTITFEMGEAHRFERELIDHALDGVRSVFAEYGIYQQETVRWPGWRTVIEGWSEKPWLRADAGGIVEMRHERGDLVHARETIWQAHLPSEGTTAPVVTDEDVLVVTGDVRVTRRETGGFLAPDREHWRISSVHAVEYSSPVIAAGRTFVGGPAGLVALKPGEND
jgi:hypothetical protein